MIYRARTESNEMFISMYEKEEPKKEQFSGMDNTYNLAVSIWQSSKREYKVRDEDKNAIICELVLHDHEQGPTERALEEKGIDCTFLKNRLKPQDVPCGKCDLCESNQSQYCYKITQQWTLLPLEDKKENEAGKWIRVEDRLPEKNQEILAFSTELQKTTSNKLVPLACFYSDKFRHYGDSISQKWLDGVKITHWMPLPEPPNI